MGKIQQCKICQTSHKDSFINDKKRICIKCTEDKVTLNRIRSKERYHSNPTYKENTKNNARNWKKNNYFEYKLKSAEYRAIKGNYSFNIDKQDLIDLLKTQNNKCFYSGIDIQNDFSIDRMNSLIGYEKDNIVLTHFRVNAAKNDMMIDDFLQMIKTIYEYNFGLSKKK